MQRGRIVAHLLDEILDEIETWPDSTRVLVQQVRSRLGGDPERHLDDDPHARKLLEPFRDELLERATAQELIPDSFIDDSTRLFVSSMCPNCKGTAIDDQTTLCLCATLRPPSIYLTARLMTLDSSRVIAQERIDRERMPHTVGHVYVERMSGSIASIHAPTPDPEPEASARQAFNTTPAWVLRSYPPMIGVHWPRPTRAQ